MAIPEIIQARFELLLKTAGNGHLVLVECTDVATKEPRYVICAISKVPEEQRDADTEVVLLPFGHLGEGNLFAVYDPPSEGITVGDKDDLDRLKGKLGDKFKQKSAFKMPSTKIIKPH